MTEILDLIEPYIPIAMIGLVLVVLIMFVLIIFLMVRLSGFRKKYNSIMRDVEEKDIAKTLERYYDRANDIFEEMLSRDKRISDIEHNLTLASQKLGLVRYDAFTDTSSKLSFALAALDRADNGFVLNGIYGREQSFLYMKPIEGGKSDQNLSGEEIEAISTAKANYDRKIAQATK